MKTQRPKLPLPGDVRERLSAGAPLKQGEIEILHGSLKRHLVAEIESLFCAPQSLAQEQLRIEAGAFHSHLREKLRPLLQCLSNRHRLAGGRKWSIRDWSIGIH